MNSFSKNNSALIIKNGPEFIKQTIDLIEQAHSFIFFHTYIFELDEDTQKILDSLKHASSKGIKVFFLLDAYGSQDFPLNAIEDLINNDIRFNFFRPFFSLKNYNRRLHQKLILIDNSSCMLGGINYAKRFNNPVDRPPWLDFSCLIKGDEVINTFQKIFPMYLRYFKKYKAELLNFNYRPTSSNKTVMVKTNINDGMKNKQEIYNSYLKAIKESKQDIFILATYFIPGKKLLSYLYHARKRGVTVHLIFSSISDLSIVKKAENYFYNWYLVNGINIYEYDKSIIHGKLALIDTKWITIGSYNHNFISRYANSEINFELINKELGNQIAFEFKEIIKNSTPITQDRLLKRESKFVLLFFYLLTNIITWICVVILYRKEK